MALAEDLPPALADHYLLLFAFWEFSLCEAWIIEAGDPVVNEPVSSDVPALIFADHPTRMGVLAENAHPFENPPLRMNSASGLFGLTS